MPDPSGFVDASNVTEQLNQARASVLHLKERLYDAHAMHGLLIDEPASLSTSSKGVPMHLTEVSLKAG